MTNGESSYSLGRRGEHLTAKMLWDKFGLPTFPCDGHQPDLITPAGQTIEIKYTTSRNCWRVNVVFSGLNDAAWWVFIRSLNEYNEWIVVSGKNVRNLLVRKADKDKTVSLGVSELKPFTHSLGLRAIAVEEVKLIVQTEWKKPTLVL